VSDKTFSSLGLIIPFDEGKKTKQKERKQNKKRTTIIKGGP